MSNDPPIAHDDMDATPQLFLGAGYMRGEDKQPSEHGVPGYTPLPVSGNNNSTAAESSPDLPKPQAPNENTGTGRSASCHRFVCELCSFSSNTKRDYTRHLDTRKHRNNVHAGGGAGTNNMAQETGSGFHCPVPDCKYGVTGETISREDNLWRHIRKVHNIKKQG
ncbi:hypothetical protein B0T20DRAFT_503921 [Sordaria brevicollis]|uniref:C2H2-type domain-containing protein n=1 Tax=Sordaria brevicollis TaxID=83679 RepID=A0AAE0UFB9_SORBR|nr:hypothetical protein B0T20DRAFT_503921 [Sordaria brevicollis]